MLGAMNSDEVLFYFLPRHRCVLLSNNCQLKVWAYLLAEMDRSEEGGHSGGVCALHFVGISVTKFPLEPCLKNKTKRKTKQNLSSVSPTPIQNITSPS